MQILAATDFSTRSNRALRQAGLLAQAPGNSQLHIVHVVDDDQPDELVSMEKREAERVLNEQTNSMPELKNVQTRPMVVTGDPFDGIRTAAADVTQISSSWVRTASNSSTSSLVRPSSV